MSITVNSISKVFGEQFALKDVSFSIPKSEIVGLLGPNGAGKSTMMKILTGYISPTSGTAEICGYNSESDNIELRRQIGYLAESNPLYYDMYVVEFLEFIAGIHKLTDKKKKIDTIIDKVALGDERRKKIGMLSKGYKQRVGLAQALIHDPQVLILDEPTTGLDPNQLREIRDVIKECGKSKTVILSTHIMQEVEYVCNRAIIINKGKIVFNGNMHDINKIAKETGLTDKKGYVGMEEFFHQLTLS